MTAAACEHAATRAGARPRAGRAGGTVARGDDHGRAARRARRRCCARPASSADHVLVTIFVNPLQFGPNEDFDRYPRTLDADLEICRAAGRRPGLRARRRRRCTRTAQPPVRVDPGPLGEELEGASRPGLLPRRADRGAQAAPAHPADLAFFGEKDYQQLTLIRRDGRATSTCRWRSSACRPCASRTGWPCPAATATCPPPSGAAALALSAALRAGARPPTTARTPTPCWPPRTRRSPPVRPACELDYLVLHRPRPRRRRRSPGRPGCWSPPGSARTRLIDNMPARTSRDGR